jgi:hypothetical protein
VPASPFLLTHAAAYNREYKRSSQKTRVALWATVVLLFFSLAHSIDRKIRPKFWK